MMIQAVLGNPHHPEYGVATIPFPIPRDQYAHCMELLEALEIGDAVKADCKVEKIDSFYTVLKRTEMLTVNVEELNYLAKRLDSFDTGEAAQFQAMAHKLELFELKDLINLTFCCQQATVITDFSDLAAIGRDHYMNLHGGSASVDELNELDGKGTARQLIESGSGTITPYGVVYDNGMKLEQVYDGRFFPCYYYEPNAITVAVTSKTEPEDTEHITWLYLPMEREEIDRALLRGGITDPADVRLRLEDSQLPNEVDILLDMEYETLSDLNELAEATDGLSKADMEKLGTVVTLAEPKSAAQIKNLAENLDLFDFAPGAHTPEDYGKYMIRQSGHFDYAQPGMKQQTFVAAAFSAGAGASAGSIGYGEELAPTLKGSASGNCMPSVLCLNDQGGSVMECSENVSGTLRAQEHGHQPLVYENHGIDARYTGPHQVAPTMSARYGTGGNNVPLVEQEETFCITGNAIDRQPQNGGNGIGYQRDIAYTLTATDHHAVYSRQRVDDFRENGVVSTQSARQHKDATDLVCQKAEAYAYLIRRLTPLECERLQGFPDGWTDIPGASDSARYKALGNSVAIPCVEFIMGRIAAALRAV